MCTLYSHIWSLKHNFHFNDKLCISNTLIKYALLAESLTISKTPVLFTILDSALLLLGQIFSKRFSFLLFLTVSSFQKPVHFRHGGFDDRTFWAKNCLHRQQFLGGKKAGSRRRNLLLDRRFSLRHVSWISTSLNARDAESSLLILHSISRVILPRLAEQTCDVSYQIVQISCYVQARYKMFPTISDCVKNSKIVFKT